MKTNKIYVYPVV